jgi:hypothetical protein
VAVYLLSSGEGTKRSFDAATTYSGGRQCNVPRDGSIDPVSESMLWLERCGCAGAGACGEGRDGDRFGDRLSSTTLKAVSHDAR